MVAEQTLSLSLLPFLSEIQVGRMDCLHAQSNFPRTRRSRYQYCFHSLVGRNVLFSMTGKWSRTPAGEVVLVRGTTLLKGAPVVMKCRMQSSTYLSRNFGSYGHSPAHDIHENRSSVDWVTGENADDLEMDNKDSIDIEANKWISLGQTLYVETGS